MRLIKIFSNFLIEVFLLNSENAYLIPFSPYFWRSSLFRALIFIIILDNDLKLPDLQVKPELDFFIIFAPRHLTSQ